MSGGTTEFAPEIRGPSPRPGPTPVPVPTPVSTATPSPEDELKPSGLLNQVIEGQDVGSINEQYTNYSQRSSDVGDTLVLSGTRYRIKAKDDSSDPGIWKYTIEPSSIYHGVNPLDELGSEEALATKLTEFDLWWSDLGQPLPPNTIGQPVIEEPMEMHGGPQEQATATSVLYHVSENAREYVRHLETEFPDFVTSVSEAQRAAGGTSRSPTPLMNYLDSTIAAWNQIAEERPEDYTSFVASDEGAAMLWRLTVENLTALPRPRVSLLDTGKFLSEVEEAYLPDVPFLKDSIQRATEIFADPLFIAALAFMPPAGVAQKARLLGEFAIGGALAGEAAEQLGVPELPAELLGMTLAPLSTRALQGFGKALMKAGAENSRLRPVPGEPALETLYRNGEVLELPELTKALDVAAGAEARPLALSEAGGFSTGKVTTLSDGSTVATGQVGGVKVALSAGARETEAISISIARLPGETPSLSSMRGLKKFVDDLANKNPFRPIEADIANPAVGRAMVSLGADEIAPGVMRFSAKRPLTAVAGGARGGTLLEQLDDMIRIHIDRPEAQDLLRKVGEKMAAKVPGAKRIVDVTNRGTLATEPSLKGAVGIEAVADYDQALRRHILAPFRGQKVPVRQNNKAQIFVPETPGAKEGEWIAQGDVVEALMRGDKNMLKNFNVEQTEFLTRLGELQKPFVETLEKLTGETLARRDVHFPRFVADIPNKQWNVSGGKGKLPSWYQRSFDVQQEAIMDYGIGYMPDMVNVVETQIAALQRVARDITLANYLKREGVIVVGRAPTRKEVIATEIVAPMGGVQPGVISIEHMNEIRALLGPASRNPLLTGPVKANSVARLLLTGVMDTGVGSLQLTTLFFTNPQGWGEAMGRSFYNMLVEPKQFYRFVANNSMAKNYARYGGNIGLESEYSAATRLSLPGREHLPEAVSKAIDVGTFVPRSVINRMQVGFDAALSYGRIFMFDAMAGPAANPGPLLRLAGARPLSGQALHDEMFRLARFTNTAIGQPELRGVISRTQEQIESGYLWFAPRYTRSLLGTFAYAFGKGYTPAQARVMLSKMLIGGMVMHAGFVTASMQLQGKSPKEIQEALARTFNPLSGKEFLSLKAGKDWYGMGGVYRAAFSAIGTLGEADNWRMDTWSERAMANPFMKIIRGRTTPFTGTMLDFMEGENFIGQEINFWEMVDDPRKVGRYLAENFLPFSLGAILQEGAWERKTARGIVEFFGLRSSPETLWEAMSPVMDNLSDTRFGMSFEELENNLPAQDWVRNHPKVKAVEEARDDTMLGFLPPLTTEQQRKWTLYRDQRDGIRDKYAQEKETLDAAFFGGHLTGRDYREQYRSLASDEFHQLLGMSEALQASLGLELSGEEAPEGTVDAVLSDYYALDLKDYTDQKTLVVDWDSFLADRDATMERIPLEFRELVEDFLGRHKGRIAKDFTDKFDALIRPSGYFDMREVVSEGLGIDLNALENAFIEQYKKEGRRASPFDVGNDVDDFLNDLLEETAGEGAPTILDLKNSARSANPKADLELYRQGYVSTVRSLEAVELGIQLKESQPELGYFIPPLAKDVQRDLGLIR